MLSHNQFTDTRNNNGDYLPGFNVFNLQQLTEKKLIKK